MDNKFVTKRDGASECFDIDKTRLVIKWATENTKANPLVLESKIDVVFFNGISTKNIQENLITHALSLVDIDNQYWLNVAANLRMMTRYKIYRDIDFKTFVRNKIESEEYSHRLSNYSDEFLELANTWIDKERDKIYDYAGANVLINKFLYPDEPLQYAYLASALVIASLEKDFQFDPKFAKDLYDSFSLKKISLASPLLNGVRKQNSNLASCFIGKMGDSIDDIYQTLHKIAKISQNGGGIGLYIGDIRANGSWVRNVEKASGGIIPWMKLINNTVVAVNQLGKRAGACTVALPIWHYDIEDFFSCQLEGRDPRMQTFDILPQIVMYDLFLQKCEEDGYWYCFDPYELKTKLEIDLSQYSSKYDWVRRYNKCIESYKNGELKLVKEYKAKYVVKLLIKTIVETGLPYLAYIDTINKHNPNKHKGDIPCTNLCVAPETLVLTDAGYFEIQELENEIVNIWNGFEWSSVQILKTGENQELLKINFSNGETLEVTHYHKFYINTHYNGKYEEVRAKDLKPNDKIIKHKFPVIEGFDEFKYAYTHGFFCGDGSVDKNNGFAHIDLHGSKRDCLPYISVKNKLWSNGIVDLEFEDEPAAYDDGIKLRVQLPLDIETKFIVPTAKHTIKSRLDWLAGVLDSDGTVAKNGTNKQLQIQSIHKDFLKNIRYMLNTLGVDAKIIISKDAGQTLLPDGKGGSKYYNCKTGYRLLITSYNTYKLIQLGMICHRLDLNDMEKPQREASAYIKVESIENNARISDTFCFTEPKRHWGIFNGILTGQCTESFSNVDDNNWHTCSLSSLNLAYIEDYEVEKQSRLITRLLDNILDICDYPIPESSSHVNNYRTIGVGVLGLADYFAKQNNTYESAYKNKLISNIFEDIAYFCIDESVELAKDRGYYNYFHGSEWENGKQIIQYLVNSELTERWNDLQNKIKKYGIRNSHLMSPAPNTTTSLIQGAVAGILPPYSLLHYDDSSNGAVAVMPPFLSDKLLAYKAYRNYDMLNMIDYIAEMQKWVDTGISFECLFDMTKTDDEGKPLITAKYIYNFIIKSWKSGIKANYYWRYITPQNTLTEKEECVSCAG